MADNALRSRVIIGHKDLVSGLELLHVVHVDPLLEGGICSLVLPFNLVPLVAINFKDECCCDCSHINEIHSDHTYGIPNMALVSILKIRTMTMKEVLEKIEEQLRCSVCLETYTNPKQLLCHHVYCVECLRPPLVKSQQGQLSVTCPLCRYVTPVPAGGVAGLQSAVRVAGLLEIRDLVTKIPGGEELDRSRKKSIQLQQELDRAVETSRQLEQQLDRAREELLRLELEKRKDPNYSFKLEHAPFQFDARLTNLLGVVRVKMHNHCKSKTTCGVAVSISGMIVASNEARHCVITSYPSHELRSFGTHGSGLGQLNSPRGVAVDGGGNILVADCNNHRIQKFTKHGEFLQAVGSKGSGRLHFVYPKDIVVNPITKMVYVVDANHRVQVLNSDLTCSKIFGTRGQSRRQFNDPHGIACDSTGKVYVADTGNHRIQVFTSKGEFILMFGRHGDGDGELDYPYSLVVDHRDLVYVSEYNNNRVSVLTLDGLYRARIGGRHLYCNAIANLFTKPRGLAVSESGVIYVSDENGIQAMTGIMYTSRIPKERATRIPKERATRTPKGSNCFEYMLLGGFIFCTFLWLIMIIYKHHLFSFW